MGGSQVDTVYPVAREARRSVRDRVIRRVQIVADGRSVDGIMLDVSRQGARVQVGSTDNLPDEFFLRSSDGLVQRVARRWARDRMLGLEFIGSADPADFAPPPRAEPAEVRNAIRTGPLHEVLAMLVRSGHYGDESLRIASRDLVAALDRVERALAGLAAPPPA